ncbi:13218_t:CDS:2, partial [Racocetra persica]
ISIIVRLAFSKVAVSELFNKHYAFILAVCNLLLNLQSKSIMYTKKHLIHHIENIFGLSYNSAEAILKNKNIYCGGSSRQASPQYKTEPEALYLIVIYYVLYS